MELSEIISELRTAEVEEGYEVGKKKCSYQKS